MTTTPNNLPTFDPLFDPEFQRLLAEEEAIERGDYAPVHAETNVVLPDPTLGHPTSQADFTVNRRVHASNPGMEVVRYDRTSKWYLEPVGYPDLPRQKVTIDEAVQYAYLECVDRTGRTRPGASVNLGLPGGNTFDRKFTALSTVER